MIVEGDGVLVVFDVLLQEQQYIFLCQVYYVELCEGGWEYIDVEGFCFGFYLCGCEVIVMLMLDKVVIGVMIDCIGDIVMYGSFGVCIEVGGNIELMVLGGQIVIGVQGVVFLVSVGLVI